MSLSFSPSMMVTALPNFLVSKRTLMRCCSLLISLQTHMSFGSPHVGQISGIVLKAYQIGREYIRMTVAREFGWFLVTFGNLQLFRVVGSYLATYWYEFVKNFLCLTELNLFVFWVLRILVLRCMESNVQIQKGNFSASEAEEFLTLGFQQIRVAAPSEVIHYAVQNLDGVAGWLTLFGTRCLDKQSCSREIVDEVVSEGGKLARAEALKLATMSTRYSVILNFLAKVGSANWAQIKAVIEAKEKHSVTNSTVSNLLNTLVKISLLSKANGKYNIVDALLVDGIRKEALPE